MYAYHFKKRNKTAFTKEGEGQLSKKLTISHLDMIETKNPKYMKKGTSAGNVEPFLQLRNPEFISPLDAFVKQRKIILDPLMDQKAIEKLLGSIS